jgi:hypothetical protein
MDSFCAQTQRRARRVNSTVAAADDTDIPSRGLFVAQINLS